MDSFWRTFCEPLQFNGSGDELSVIDQVMSQLDELGLTRACVEELKPALHNTLAHVHERRHADELLCKAHLLVFIPTRVRLEAEGVSCKSWGFFIVQRIGDENEQVIELFLYQEGICKG